MSSIVLKAQALINQHKLIVFAKSTCPYCRKSIQHLTNGKLTFHAEMIDSYPASEMNEVQDYFLKTTGARTVPRIFFNKKCIGGNSDLEAQYVTTGKLDLLRQ